MIICPSTLKKQWKEDLEKWASPLLKEDEKIQIIDKGKDKIEGKVCIISTDLAAKMKDELSNKFNVIVLDESHSIKDFKSLRSKNLCPLLKDSKRTILLSGKNIIFNFLIIFFINFFYFYFYFYF